MNKKEAIEIVRTYLKKEILKMITEKVVIYNLDVETYQLLKEEEITEMTFEEAVSGYKYEGIEIGKKQGIEIGEQKKK